MRLSSSQVGIGSKEQDFAGSVDSSLLISCTNIGSSSVSGSTSLGMMTGAAAAAVDARILATLSTKNLAKSSALSLTVADCDGVGRKGGRGRRGKGKGDEGIDIKRKEGKHRYHYV